LKFFYKIFGLFDTKHKLLFLTFIFFGVATYFLELLTLSSLLPIISIFIEGDNFENSKYGVILQDIFQLIGISTLGKNLVNILLVAFFSLFIARTILSILFILYQNHIIAKLTIYIQSKFLNYFNNTDLANPETDSLSSFIRVLEDDSGRVVGFVQTYLEIFVDILFIFSVLFVLSKVSFDITLISSFLLLLSIILVFLFSRNKIKNLATKRQYYSAKTIENMQQIFSISLFIRLLNKQKFFLNKFVDLNKNKMKFENRKKLLVKSPKFIIEFFIVMCLLSLVYYFINFINIEKRSEFIPTLGFFLICILRISPSVNKITNSLQELRYIKVSAALVYNLITGNIENTKSYLEKSKTKLKDFDSIKLTNIDFGYKGIKIFSNLNFEIKKGQKIGLISPSGSGKSTFLSILLGIIKPTAGAIEIDDLKYEFTSQLSRNFFGYVPQKNFYFNSSIKENIAFGVKETAVDEEHLKKITQIVGLNENNFGKDFEIKNLGENGSNFSGGQLQRISLARSLYFKPKILILDEATNQLDKAAEEKLLGDIISNFKNLTLVIVSHNFSSIKDSLDLYSVEKFQLKKIN